MAIAKNPQRNLQPNPELAAESFISHAGGPTVENSTPNKTPIMIRVDPAMLIRIDRAAKRLGLSRSGFIVSSAAEKLEQIGG